jgi:hypothetical protein
MDADGSNPQQVGNLQLAMNNPIAKPQLAKNGLIVFSDQQGAPQTTPVPKTAPMSCNRTAPASSCCFNIALHPRSRCQANG